MRQKEISFRVSFLPTHVTAFPKKIFKKLKKLFSHHFWSNQTGIAKKSDKKIFVPSTVSTLPVLEHSKEKNPKNILKKIQKY